MRLNRPTMIEPLHDESEATRIAASNLRNDAVEGLIHPKTARRSLQVLDSDHLTEPGFRLRAGPDYSPFERSASVRIWEPAF